MPSYYLIGFYLISSCFLATELVTVSIVYRCKVQQNPRDGPARDTRNFSLVSKPYNRTVLDSVWSGLLTYQSTNLICWHTRLQYSMPTY